MEEHGIDPAPLENEMRRVEIRPAYAREAPEAARTGTQTADAVVLTS
jgi:hypothetical protein